MIRFRLVVGLLDANLADKLRLVSDLTQEHTVQRAHHSEAVKRQDVFIHHATSTSSPVQSSGLDAVPSSVCPPQPAMHRQHGSRSRRRRGDDRSRSSQKPQRKLIKTRLPVNGADTTNILESDVPHEQQCVVIVVPGHFATVCRSQRQQSAIAHRPCSQLTHVTKKFRANGLCRAKDLARTSILWSFRIEKQELASL